MVARCLNLLVEGKILDQMILRILLLICYGATLYATDNHDHAEYYARAMYNISRSIYVEHGSHQQKVPKVHLIRVPKASSSSMSQVARRIAGCTPVGPCCKWPGDPPGSCPSKALFQCQLEGRVIGCTHHHPFYSVLLNPLIPSLTMMRDPVSRSLSAFFYSGIHHNSDCTNRVFHGMSTMNPTHLALRTNSTTMGLMKCFQGYASASSWQNVFTKLLNGKYAYAPVRAMADTIVSTSSLELAQRNIDKLFFVGVTELWELSLLVLFAKLPTVPPDLEEFLLERGNTGGASVLPQKQVAGGIRFNDDFAYTQFREHILTNINEPSVQRLIHEQNGLDIILYQSVVKKLCSDLHVLKLWESYSVVRDYWRERAPIWAKRCTWEN